MTSGNGQNLLPGNNPPPDVMREDAIEFLVRWAQAEGPDRGPFVIDREGSNLNLSGVAIPAWLMTVLNVLAGHPMTPYAHDRATLHRDLILMGAAAWAQILSQWANDDDTRNLVHIIRTEEQLRREVYVEELMLNFVEDLAIIAGTLELKIAASAHAAVYDQLHRLFHHIEQVQDHTFWRPTLHLMLANTPEILLALHMLGDHDRYRHDDSYISWQHIIGGAAKNGIKDSTG